MDKCIVNTGKNIQINKLWNENIVNSNVELKLGKFLRMGKDRTKKLEVIR